MRPQHQPEHFPVNDTDKPDDEPHIIVDDDYKNRVAQERERLRQEMESSPQGTVEGMEMPPASIPMLITTLATQALSNLGQIPDPIEGQAVIRKPVAKHFIDTLAILETKTQGNLTEEENELLNGTLHQLRMVFVATPDSMPAASAGTGPTSPTIELP